MKTAMPTLPLYKEVNDDKTLLKSLPQNSNAGLWYDKFCSSWEKLLDRQNIKFEKLEWINKTVTNRPCGNNEELERQRNRRWEMVAKLGGHNLCLKTDSPFVTGLGRDHPVENGFLWHHTLGVPCLPGSSIKGMVRAWIEQWAEEKDKKEKEEIDRIFGPKQPTEQPQVGAVVFLDAIPLSSVPLKAEVMTPHYGKYCQEGKAPGDWISPVPIPFLAVKEGAIFHFAIVPRRQPCLEAPGESEKSSGLPVGKSREGNHRADCEIVLDCLKEALEWIGAGAKTAVGYGRMSLDKDAQKRCEDEYEELLQKKANLTTIRCFIQEEDARWVGEKIHSGRWDGKNDDQNRINFLNDVEKFLADKKRLSIEAYRRLFNKMSEFWPGIMENPDAVQGKKRKPKYKERPRNLAKKLNALCKENTTKGEK